MPKERVTFHKFDWGTTGNRICTVLHMIYRESAEKFALEARKRGISIESLAAAAICGMLQDMTGTVAPN